MMRIKSNVQVHRPFQPDGVAENLFQADDYQRLRNVYQGKLSESAIN
jgi:hypothetical protein